MNNFYSRYPQSSGVTTLNGLSGALTLAPGSGIAITDNGLNTITISNTQVQGVTTLAPVGSAPNANAGIIAGQVLTLEPANASFPGVLLAADWVTFNNKQNALTFGNLTDVGTDGIIITGGTGAVIGTGTSIAQTKSDATHNGYLSSTDWSTFNAKQPALTIGNLTDAGTDGITVTNGTGAVIGTGTSLSQHVADATHNGYLSSTDWSTFNGKGTGSVTSVSVTTANGVSGTVATATTTPAITLTLGAITPSSVAATGTVTGSNLSGTNTGDVTIGTANGLSLVGQALSLGLSSTSTTGALSSTDWNTFNGKQPAGNYITALTGDVTASGPGSVASTLATVNGSPGSFTYSSLTVNGKGLVTAASSGAAPVTTLAAVGASPNANAATISGNTLNLQPFSGTQPGVVTASGGGTTNFLRADGTWAAAGGGTSINARYFNSATNISGGGPLTVVYTTKDFDTNNAYSAGTYTIPTTGKYDIKATVLLTTTSGTGASLNQFLRLSIFKNGSVVSENNTTTPVGITSLWVEISDLISCSASDTITISLTSNISATISISSSNTRNFFSIFYTGT